MKRMHLIIVVEVLLLVLLQSFVIAQQNDIEKYKGMTPGEVAQLSESELNANMDAIAAAGQLGSIDATKLSNENLGKYVGQLSASQLQSFSGADFDRLLTFAGKLSATQVKAFKGDTAENIAKLKKLAPKLRSPAQIQALDGRDQLSQLLPNTLDSAQKGLLKANQLSGAISKWRQSTGGVQGALKNLGNLGDYDPKELAKALEEHYGSFCQ